jgi:23S rRNA pseudouridine2605 synthase
VAERIHKALADAGLGSRRAIERWVTEGRITIDGRVAKVGDHLVGRERICIDGRPVKLQRSRSAVAQQHIAYYTAGNAASRSFDERGSEPPRPWGADAAIDILDVPKPKRGRWIDVAPLDPSSSGLLILTTDGALANRLARPGARIEREYAVRVIGELSDAQIDGLTAGTELEDGITRFDSVTSTGGSGQNRWYHIVLRDSRHRRVRESFAAIGAPLSRVIRIRFGPIELGKLRRGTSRPLAATEVDGLYGAAGLSADRDS